MANAVSCFFVSNYLQKIEKLQNICPKHFFYADINFRCNGFTQISFQTGSSSDRNQFFQAGISPVAIDGRSVLAVVSITVGQVVGRTQPPGIGGIVVKIGKIL